MTDLTVGRVLPAVTIDVPMPKCAPPRSDDLELRIARLALGPDDVLVVKRQVPGPISVEHAERVRSIVRDAAGPNTRILVIDASTDLAVLTRAEIEARTDPVPNVIRFMGKDLGDLTSDDREMARRYAQKTLADDGGMFTHGESRRKTRELAQRMLDALA